MTFRALVVGILILWTLFAVGSYAFSPPEVFHHLNALSLSAGVIAIVAYAPALRDAWRQRQITPAHLVALAIVSNWSGFIIRLGRWYFTQETPTRAGSILGEELAQWAYNVGLWITCTAAILLVGAIALTEPRWSPEKVWWHVVAFIVLTGVLWYLFYIIP